MQASTWRKLRATRGAIEVLVFLPSYCNLFVDVSDAVDLAFPLIADKSERGKINLN